MRYLIPALILLAAAQANAAFDQPLRNSFLQGCEKNPSVPAEKQAILNTGCECILGKLEGSLTQAQFLNLHTQPDGGKSVLVPIAEGCLIPTK